MCIAWPPTRWQSSISEPFRSRFLERQEAHWSACKEPGLCKIVRTVLEMSHRFFTCFQKCVYTYMCVVMWSTMSSDMCTNTKHNVSSETVRRALRQRASSATITERRRVHLRAHRNSDRHRHLQRAKCAQLAEKSPQHRHTYTRTHVYPPAPMLGPSHTHTGTCARTCSGGRSVTPA